MKFGSIQTIFPKLIRWDSIGGKGELEGPKRSLPPWGGGGKHMRPERKSRKDQEEGD